LLSDFFRLNDEENAQVFSSYASLETHFQHADMLKNAVVQPGSTSKEKSKLFTNHRFENVAFRRCVFTKITFQSSHFSDCIFTGSIFSDCWFHNCTFSNCNPYKVIFNNTYINPKIFWFNRRYKSTHANIGLGLFQSLYANAQAMAQTEFIENADVLRRCWQRSQWYWERNQGRIDSWTFVRRFVTNFLFEKVALYGYRPVRFLAYSLGFFSIISLPLHVYWDQMGFHETGVLLERGDLSQTLFYTASLITTLGFANIIPSTIFGRVYAIALALTGIAWIGVFTALLVRRVIR
jgi:uncharacterized protein YjbI with pentapeptide repeats